MNEENSLNEIESYLVGFIQTDGHRGSFNISIELSIKDVDILEKINNYFDNKCNFHTRTRDTNFKKNYTSVILTIKDKIFISKINSFVPIGSKSIVIETPKNIQFFKKDYWRGVFDGDGSLGIKNSNNAPYISLVTGSEQLYLDLKEYIKDNYNFELNLNRNKRDNIYNITLLDGLAYLFVKDHYLNSQMVINRKMTSANNILNFDYYHNVHNKYNLTPEDDVWLLAHNKKEIKLKYPEVDNHELVGRKIRLLNLKKIGLYKE